MGDYEEVVETIDIPKGAGVDGFLRTIKAIIKLPRVQSITIDTRGKISYARHVLEGDGPRPLNLDLETLTPFAVLRSCRRVKELLDVPVHPSDAMAKLFHLAAVDHLCPVALVGGANSHFFRWHLSTGIDFSDYEELVYGLPFLRDRYIEDDTLFLCAAYGREASLIDTQKSYRILIPRSGA